MNIERKTAVLNKILKKVNKQNFSDYHRRLTISIDKMLESKKEIDQKCQDLNIEIIGIFGNLAKFGYSEPDDNSGILIKVFKDDMLDSLEKFKKYICDLIKYRIKIIEERQLKEYLELKVNNENDRREFLEVFLQTTKNNSLEHLENNRKLINHVEFQFNWELSLNAKQNKSVKIEQTSVEDIISFLDSTDKISFEHFYDEQQPILHALCHAYLEYKWESIKLLELIKVILEKGADLNVQNKFGDTILHIIGDYEYDNQLLDCLSNSVQENNFNFNLLNKYNQCPLEIAIVNKRFQLIEFLKIKTNFREYGKDLMIAATEYGNIELIRYFISEYHVDCDIKDDTGRPIIHYAIFKQKYPAEFIDLTLNDPYREIVKLLIENGAVVDQFYHGNKQEVPLLWALENKDIEIALLLIEKYIRVNYNNKDYNCPIHLAILNLRDCLPEERSDYLKLIRKIAEKANENGDGLNQEYAGFLETPLYLAAQQEDIGIIQILLQNGADINYKTHRFNYQVLIKVKNLEILKIFLDNGLILDLKRCADYMQHKKKPEELDLIYDYLSEHARLFSLYSTDSIDEIKKLVLQSTMNLKVFNKDDEDDEDGKDDEDDEDGKDGKDDEDDEDGKDLFFYALVKQDISFIEWLVDNNGVNVNYHHLSNYTNGLILEFLNNKALIDWSKFDSKAIRTICENALTNNDQKAIKLLEIYKYIDISQSINNFPTENSVKQFLIPYLNVFDKIKKREEAENLKILIRDLQNKFVILENISMQHAAAYAGNLDILKFLIEEIGLDINVQTLNGSTLIEIAIEMNSGLEIFNYLVLKKAHIDKNFNFNLISKLSNDKQQILIKYFKTITHIKKIINSLDYTYFQNLDVVKFLLELGWDPDEYEERYSFWSGGFTALHRCVYNKYNETLKFLCENEIVDIEAPVANYVFFFTSGTRTPVGWALESGNFEGAKILIEHGASSYKYLGVLLIDALRKKDTEYFILLLEKSVIIDLDEMNSYLNKWIKEKITQEELSKAATHFDLIKDIVKEKLTEYIIMVLELLFDTHL